VITARPARTAIAVALAFLMAILGVAVAASAQAADDPRLGDAQAQTQAALDALNAAPADLSSAHDQLTAALATVDDMIANPPVTATPATLAPTADTFVNGNAPTTSYGTDTTMKVDDGYPKIAYVKFPAPSGTVNDATLRLYGDGAQDDLPFEVYEVSSTWPTPMTYNNRPTLGTLVGSGTVVANGYTEVAVSGVSDGVVPAFAIVRSGTGTDSIFATKESANGPQLVVNGGGQPGPLNTAPTVSAGADGSVTLPATYSLDGTVSDDGNPPGGTVTTAWTTVSGPGTVTFADATAVDTTATFSTAGTYVLRLTADDTELATSDDITVTVSPEVVSPPPTGDGILLSASEIAALPTTGSGWQAIVDRVNSPYGGCYCLGQRDKSDLDVLAHALYGAREGDTTAKNFVRDKISHVMTAGRTDSDVLATLRNFSSYIVSADLIDLKSYAPTVDAKFRTWISAELKHQYSGGGGGGSILSIADYKANNFGTHANADRLIAGLYLGDDAMYTAARDVWYGWATGDSSYIPSPRNWTGTNWQCDYLGSARYGINPQGCTRDGHSFDGIIPEDMTRQGEYSSTSWPPPGGAGDNYIHGAMDGATLSFWVISHHGAESAWAWGNNAALRQMQWKYNNGQAPYSGFKWQIPVIEKAYGVSFAGNDPTATSTNFGFADWWAQ
jgi:hypothetical protein